MSWISQFVDFESVDTAVYFCLPAVYFCVCLRGVVYRVAKTHRIPYLYGSFSAKVTYISWLFCGK